MAIALAHELACGGRRIAKLSFAFAGRAASRQLCKQTMKRSSKAAPKLQTTDEYIAAQKPEQRAALQRLREVILAAAPGAEECISYGVPAFRLKGRFLLAFGAAASHCAFYPGAVVEAFQEELKAWSTSKGTIRFQPDHPLPKALVKKLVKAQIARKGPRGAA
jgi:uncharacterized protein YdhG (YjbR/CyaY superfamily)